MKMLLRIVVAAVVFSTGSLALDQCQKELINYDHDAQAVVTGLFSIREAVHGTSSSSSKDSKRTRCGPVTLGGLQTLELVQWALELLNQRSGSVFGEPINSSFVPGVKIGLQAFDTCGLTNLAVQHALESQTDTYVSQQHCSPNNTVVKLGLIGPASAEAAKAVSSVVNEIDEPVVMFGPVSENILEKRIISTMPSLTLIASAMLDLAKQFEWTQVVVLMEEGVYEEEGRKQFGAVGSSQICISDFIQLPKELRADKFDKIMQKLSKNLPHAPVVFIFGSADSSLQLLQFASSDKYNSYASNLKWVLSDGFGQDNVLIHLSQVKLARGIFVVAPILPDDLPEFKQYWNGLSALHSDNPWSKDFYQRALKCRFPDESSPEFATYQLCVSEKFSLTDATEDFFVSPFALAILDAVYGYGLALKEAWFKQCGGRTGICPQLVSMSNEAFWEILKNTEFTYGTEMRTPPSLQGRSVNFKSRTLDAAVYELQLEDNQIGFAQVFKYGPKQRLVASVQPTFYYANGTTGITPPLSGCPRGECTCINAQHSVSYIYKPGTLVLSGMFPLHNTGSGNAAVCGDLRSKDGHQFVEAFWYALNKINTRQPPFNTMLRGMQLGSLALDSCNNPMRAGYLFGGMMTGDMEYKHEGYIVNPVDVIGMIGEYNDNVSTEIASMLTYFKLPQIAYGAKTAVLNDKLLYPTVLRAVVSDATRMQMTFEVLKELQWDYVQLITSTSEYGRLMANMFKVAAQENDVCIAQSLTISANLQDSDMAARLVVEKSHVSAVVIFAEKAEIRSFLEHLGGYQSYSQFTIIAPDNWANDVDLIAGAEKSAIGSLSFAPRRLQNALFTQHLMERSVQKDEYNPWLIEYIENNLHCNFPGTTTRQYSAACNPRVSVGQIPGFRPDPHTNDIINSVYAFALGLHSMLEKYCGSNYEGVCNAFMNAPQRNVLLYEFIRQVNFEDETGRNFAFTEERDSATPIAVFNLRPSDQAGSGLQYFQAGAYPTSSQKILNHAAIEFLSGRSSSCEQNTSYCSECRRVVVQQYVPETTRPVPTAATRTTPPVRATTMDDEGRSVRRQELNEFATKPFLYQPSPQHVVLGAIFPIHEPGSVPFQCGAISEESILMLEAYLWAVDAMNANSDILNGLTIGTFTIDSCASSGETFTDLKNLYTKSNYFTNTNKSQTVDVKNVLAFINDPGNGPATSAAEIFSSNAMPNIASYSPTDILSEWSSFPYTLRTALPYKVLNSAIVDVLVHLNWTFVAVIYSRGMWGQDRFARFKNEASDKGVCVAYSDSVSFPADNSTNVNLILKQLKLVKQLNVRALVLLTEPKDGKMLVQHLNHARQSGIISPNDFTIIGTFDMEAEEAAANLGAIIVHHDSAPVEPFWSYVLSLKYNNNERNPWWKQFWSDKFKCDTEEDCDRHSLQTGILPDESILMNIMNAVWAFAIGLSNLMRQMCPDARFGKPLCDRMMKQITLRDMIYRHVKAAGFGRADNPNEAFRFTEDGGPDIGLNILNLVVSETAGNLQYIVVGQYRNGTLRMSHSPVVYDGNKAISPAEVFSKCVDQSHCPHCKLESKHVHDEEHEETTTTKIKTTESITGSTITTTTTTTITPSSTSMIPSTSLTQSPTASWSTEMVAARQSVYSGSFIYKPSTDGWIVPAVFPVHNRGKLPFTCGHIQQDVYENVQSFLWALKTLNDDPTFLPGIRLGALILDTCSDVSKGLRDFSNFLSKQITFKSNDGTDIDPSHALAVLNSPSPDEALPIANLLDPWMITSISSGMSPSMLNLGDLYNTEYALKSSVPTDVQSKAVAEMLKRLKWDAVVVLYTDNVWGTNGKMDFEEEATQSGICIPLSESVPESKDGSCTSSVDETFSRLIHYRRNGVRGVILWLTPLSLRCLMLSAKRALTIGTMKPGDITFIAPADVPDLDNAFSDFAMETVGMLVIRYDTEPIVPFQAYLQNLKPNSSTDDPWIKEYFETLLCKDEACTEKISKVAVMAYNPNAYLLNTINAVYSIAHGLDDLRKSLCGSTSVGMCTKLKTSMQFRRQIFDSIRGTSFTDVTGKKFEFTHNLYGNQALQIMNLVRGANNYEFRAVGVYEMNELKMRVPPQGFENGIQAFNLRERPSSCMDFTHCPICKILSNVSAVANESNGKIAMAPSLLENEMLESSQNLVANNKPFSITVGSVRAMQDAVIIPPSRKFSIAGIFPVHNTGSQSFSCGKFNPSSGFQKMVAFLYALREVNRDPYVLPGIELGAIAIDSCSSEERAMADLFEFLSQMDAETNIKAEDVVSVVGLGDKESVHLHSLLKYLEIPQVSSVPTSLASYGDPWMLGTVPSEETHIHIYVEIATLMKWSYVSVLYEASSAYETTVNYFRQKANKYGICIAKQVALNAFASAEEAQIAVRQLVLATGSRSVYVFIGNKNLIQFMKALIAERVPIGRFMLVTTFNEDWSYDPEFLALLPRFGQGLLTIENQRYNLTNFFTYMSSMTLQKHQPIPDAWFDEFWQHTFQCVLNSSKKPQYQFSTPCTGREKFNSSDFAISPSVLPTILGVHIVAKGLQKFLEHNCPAKPANSLEQCLQHNPKGQFLKALKSVNFTYAHEPGKDPIWVSFDQNGFMKFDYSIRNLFREIDGNYRSQEVGMWRPSTGLMLDANLVLLYDGLGERKTPESTCPADETCPVCHNTTVIISASKPTAGLNFNTVWGVVVAAFAILGICVCLVCIFYFIITFPVAYGTTILGYMILFGLLLIYGLSFAYVVTPNDITCPVRRFCTGICWAFVFGPMLVKVVHTWHMRSFEGNLMNPEHQTSPCALFCLAMGVIGVQVIIALEWVILQQPELMAFVTTYRGESLETGLWRCDPGETFETMLIISISYVIVLIFLTTVFSLMTWNADVHNRESRWIFVACIFSICIWLAWTLVSTRTPYKFRDAAVAVGLVSNASVVLLCLYLRKAYLYNKYRQQAKDFVDNHSGYQVSTMGRPFMIDEHSTHGSKGPTAAIGYHTRNPLMLQNLTSVHDSGYGQYEGGSEFHTNSLRVHSQTGLSAFEKSSVDAQHF